MTEVFTCLRCCNVTLRWLFLHTCSSHKKLRAAVASSAPPMQDLLTVLLDTALLEFEVSSPASKGAAWMSLLLSQLDSYIPPHDVWHWCECYTQHESASNLLNVGIMRPPLS